MGLCARALVAGVGRRCHGCQFPLTHSEELCNDQLHLWYCNTACVYVCVCVYFILCYLPFLRRGDM